MGYVPRDIKVILHQQAPKPIQTDAQIACQKYNGHLAKVMRNSPHFCEDCEYRFKCWTTVL